MSLFSASQITRLRKQSLGQSMCDWLESHIRAFEFFGGTTTIVVPDNLESGVNKASPYGPVLNCSYNAMAEHYGYGGTLAMTRLLGLHRTTTRKRHWGTVGLFDTASVAG